MARPAINATGSRRVVAAWLLTVVALPLATWVATRFRVSIDVSTVLLVALSLVLVIAVLGGRLVGAVAAIVASLLVNWFFVLPLHTLSIAEPSHLVALVVFVAVAIVVGWLVDTASLRALEAQHARRETEVFARSAASLATHTAPLEQMVDHIRTSYDFAGVCLRRRDGDGWISIAVAGDPTPPPAMELAVASPGVEEAHVLQLYGRRPLGDEARALRIFADQLAAALHAEHLAAEVAAAVRLAEVDALRTALLRAVSHDLRTPLASIKAMISGLRDPDVEWTPQQYADALQTVDEETDRLNRVVGNLLDASRLQIGALAVDVQRIQLTETIAAALDELHVPPDAVEVSVAAELPPVLADPVLLERCLVNVVGNALRHNNTDVPVRITATVDGTTGEIAVCDHGPGIPVSERSRVLEPFQRLGDARGGDGVGLGLSIAQGFMAAMSGTLRLDSTPGGGLTVTLAVPR